MRRLKAVRTLWAARFHPFCGPFDASTGFSDQPKGTDAVDWKQEALMAMQVILAVVLGGAVGWEREWHRRDAGIRTYGAVSLGACVFALLSTHITTGNNPHVIAAGVVTGIGFLGAGVILRDQGRVVGLTTAATLWATASIGLATGYRMYTLAALVSLLVFGLLFLHHVPMWERLKEAEGPLPDCSQGPTERHPHGALPKK